MAESLFNKVAGLRRVTLLKKRPWHRCFPVTFVKLLRTLFFVEHLWWLLNVSETNKLCKHKHNTKETCLAGIYLF